MLVCISWRWHFRKKSSVWSAVDRKRLHQGQPTRYQNVQYQRQEAHQFPWALWRLHLEHETKGQELHDYGQLLGVLRTDKRWSPRSKRWGRSPGQQNNPANLKLQARRCYAVAKKRQPSLRLAKSCQTWLDHGRIQKQAQPDKSSRRWRQNQARWQNGLLDFSPQRRFWRRA